jgi:hypothetical protein
MRDASARKFQMSGNWIVRNSQMEAKRRNQRDVPEMET